MSLIQSTSNVFRCLISIHMLIYGMEATLHTQRNNIEQICSDATGMLRSGLSQHEVNRFLRSQLNQEMDRFNQNKNEIYGKRSLGNDETLGIDVSTSNKVGKFGQFFRVNNIATDSAMNSNIFPLFYQQDNNFVRESELDEFIAFITLGLSLGLKNSKEKRDRKDSTSIGSSHPTLDNMEKCRDMIKATHRRTIEEISLLNEKDQSREESSVSSRGGNNDNDNFDSERNSTRIRTRYDIGFGGYMANSDNIATGQSVTNIGSELGDVQTHSNYKNSKIKIFRIDATPVGKK
ncbi:uncharacterized protein LOC141855546 isoform X2 [Brevipalpus obovatus]|uniref:uncharacterized protein LOC141855546 isoform X2 n=1 Tax=Brevipalpus obovatus TaxID=246614 RepID=UPI003D9DF7C3